MTEGSDRNSVWLHTNETGPCTAEEMCVLLTHTHKHRAVSQETGM